MVSAYILYAPRSSNRRRVAVRAVAGLVIRVIPWRAIACLTSKGSLIEMEMRATYSPCVRRVTAVASFCVLALFGCSALYTKVERAAMAPVMPDVACLMGKLRDVADDRAVTYTVQDLAPTTAHALSYIHSRTYFSWWILEEKGRTVKITDSVGLEDSRRGELPRMRKRMLEVEATVRDRCGLGVVMDSARETCTGQVCGAL